MSRPARGHHGELDVALVVGRSAHRAGWRSRDRGHEASGGKGEGVDLASFGGRQRQRVRLFGRAGGQCRPATSPTQPRRQVTGGGGVGLWALGCPEATIRLFHSAGPKHPFATASGDQNPDALEFLLDHALDRFDPTSVLVHFVGTHQREPGETCTQDCPLQRLLKMGADPNARGSPCTPLQIAVVGRDLHGIQTLLEAGADPSAIGSNEVKNWEEGAVLREFSGLRGVKPVDILSTWERWAMGAFDNEVEDDEVIQLLMGST